ncbi:tyrosine-type recombinase/integrase [Alteromonas sp. S015]|uniref:tyrosine-type recombinase/integrase n=1 Tax=Alteromonas sp. S015 TaxID=3117401 RepID=UPI002FDFB8EA
MPNAQLKLIPSPSIQTSPYHLYLQTLSPTGRRSMASLLNTCTKLLSYPGKAEDFDWPSFSYAKAMMIRSAMLQADYAINTINMSISALKGVMQTAFNLELINADRLARIKAVKPVKGNAQKRQGRVLSAKEVKALIRACEKHSEPSGIRNKALLLTALSAGLRCSELCTLTIADIDLQTGRLLVASGKGRKQRIVYVNRQATEAIQAWLAIRTNKPGPLFVRILKGQHLSMLPLTPNGITHLLQNFRKQANIPPFSPHDLRRTFITRLLEEDVDLNTVRMMAGHSDISTTIRYDKRNENSSKSIVACLSLG